MTPFRMTAMFVGLLIASASFLPPTLAVAGNVQEQRQAKKPADCLLILQGKHIDKLVLRDKQGKIVELVHPAARVTLPAGEYQIEWIEVEGGYQGGWSIPPFSLESPSSWPPPSDRLLVLRPDKPCDPKIGMPLTPMIAANRVGRLIKVSYNPFLRDGDRRGSYFCTLQGSHPPPTFTVYQGDRNITALGAGSLEFS
jgi:hypothetical protein